MKNKLKKTLLLFIASIALTSCNKDEDNSQQYNLENLKTVEFTETPEKEIKSEKTGNIITDPTTGTNKYEYLTVVEKPYTVAPLSILSQTSNDVIYPGSILRGDSFMKGAYDPLVLENEFNSIVLTLTLRGNISVAEHIKPVLSQVKALTNDVIAQQKDKIDYEFLPTVYTYESNNISTEDSFKKSLKIHASENVLGGIVKAGFGYDRTHSTNYTKKYVMVTFRQSLYNASIDPKHYSKWINGNINTKDIGEYEPVYISNVKYGKIAHVLVQTEKKKEEVMKMIKNSLGVELGYLDASTNTPYTSEFKKLFVQEKIKVLINGGPVELAGQVNNYKSFVKFIQMPTAKTLVQSSVPIAYKVRRLKDNTELEVRDTYTESIIELKNN